LSLSQVFTDRAEGDMARRVAGCARVASVIAVSLGWLRGVTGAVRGEVRRPTPKKSRLTNPYLVAGDGQGGAPPNWAFIEKLRLFPSVVDPMPSRNEAPDHETKL